MSEKRRPFANVSLTRNTISDHFPDFAADIDVPLKERVAPFVTFSVATDDSTDITDVAQLATFIRGANAGFTVKEKFVQFQPMTGMTKAEDIIDSLVGSLDNVGVARTRAVTVATEGAPSMTGKEDGVAAN